MNGNASFKKSITLSLIAVGLNLLILLFSFLYFTPHSTFAKFYVEISSLEYAEGMNIAEMFEEFGVTAEIFYLSILLINILTTIMVLAILTFTLLCRNDHKLNLINYNRRRTLHVFYIVCLGIGFLCLDSNLISTFSPYASICGLLEVAVFVLYLIAFIFALKGEITNSRLANSIGGYNRYESKKYYSGYSNREYDNVNEVYEAPKVDEVEEKEELPSETVSKEKDYTELYELLAKLEKQYKNGEIDSETYQRMKKTLLESYI
jgi:hypothetical protein